MLIGAVAGFYANASQKVIALVMAVGAGVLVASMASEPMEESYDKGASVRPRPV